MKMNANLRAVENNAAATKDFTIQASGKMFHMVISGLYSNKPQSITREIWSNAFDAHAMVGKEHVPFLVTFPTALTPTFSCRDFGPGIAHEDMEGFYTVLGHSTKEDTNKAVGKWGVGRMSPMSYTDTFSVVSYHKGKVSYYAVQLGADGSPQLHVLSEPMPTTEPDGLEVSFPVKRQDISAFQTAAEVVSYGFDVPPLVTNSKEKEFKPLKKVFEGEGFYLYQDTRLSGAYAQMGCVLYPIPREHLPRLLNIVYKFDIGDLEVTASREALSFGPKDPTKESIAKKAEEVELALWKGMQKKIEDQPCLFDAAKLAPTLRGYLKHSSPNFTYKGVEIPKFWDLQSYKHILISTAYKSYRQKQAGWGLDKTIDVKNEYTIYIQDLSDKKGNARAATRIGADVDSYKYYIWVMADLTNKDDKEELDKFLSDLDYPHKYVKDLPDPGPKKSGPRAKVSVSYLSVSGPVKGEMSAEEFDKGGYYHPMSNNDYPRIYYKLMPLVEKIFGQKIILVPKTLWKKFEGNIKWRELELALNSLVRKEAANVQKNLGNRYDIYPLVHLRDFRDMTGPVGDFAKKVAATSLDSYLGVVKAHWNDILTHYGLSPIHDKDSTAEYKALLDKYPLLDLYSNSKRFGDFGHYITLIDQNNSKGDI